MEAPLELETSTICDNAELGVTIFPRGGDWQKRIPLNDVECNKLEEFLQERRLVLYPLIKNTHDLSQYDIALDTYGKDVPEMLTQVITDRIKLTPPGDWPGILETVRENLREHLLDEVDKQIDSSKVLQNIARTL